MTKKQREILESLKLGDTIQSRSSEWYHKSKKLRAETQLALESTGELVEINPLGIYHGAGGSMICHKSKAGEIIEKIVHVSGIRDVLPSKKAGEDK